MESQHYFKIFYGQVCVWSVVAHTKWEAIDKAYYKFTADGMELDRKKMTAKKLY